MRTLFRWLWPGGLIVAADLALLRWVDAPVTLDGWVVRYSWVVLLGTALLAWRFRRSRTVALALVLGLLSVHGASTGLPPAEALVPGMPDPWQLASILTLGGLALLALSRDRSVLSPVGALQIAFLASVAAAGLTLYRWVPLAELGPTPESIPWLAPLIRQFLGMPTLFWWSVLLALGTTVFQAIRFDSAAERGLAWTVVGLALVSMAVPGSAEARIHIMATGLILMLTSVETSYALAFRDELTGLPTRRALNQFFDSVMGGYAVAMVDVDHFKKFNDRHGHDVGDQVLKMVATRLERVSGGGTAFRYGGEEFTVVFPGKSRDEALPHLEALRADVEAASFRVRRFGRPRKKPAGGEGKGKKSRKSPRRLSVTVSMGVAERTEKHRTPGQVIKAADRALYRAKRKGRNRVSI